MGRTVPWTPVQVVEFHGCFDERFERATPQGLYWAQLSEGTFPELGSPGWEVPSFIWLLAT